MKSLILPGAGVVLIFVAFIGLIWYAAYRQSQFYEESVKKCQNVAKLAGGSDSIYSNGDCYIIKGTKLEKV